MKEVSAAYRNYLQAALTYQFCCTHGKMTSIALNNEPLCRAYMGLLMTLARLDQAAADQEAFHKLHINYAFDAKPVAFWPGWVYLRS